MKAKTKLIMSIMSICLVCAVFAIGVFALKTANLKIGGDVSFNATGVNAEITNAKLSNGTQITDLADVSITTAKTQTEIDSQMTTWVNLPITFDANATEITLSFDVANTSTGDNYIEMDYEYSFTTSNPNVGISPSVTNDYILEPKASATAANTFKNFALSFVVANKELDVPRNTILNLTILLKHIVPEKLDLSQSEGFYFDKYHLLYFLDKTTNPYTADLWGNPYLGEYYYDGTAYIPAVVTDGIDNYIVTSVGESTVADFDCYPLSEAALTVVLPNSIVVYSRPLNFNNIPRSITEIVIDEGWFSEICIPSNIKKVEFYRNDYRRLHTISVEPGNRYFDSRDNCGSLIETATNILIKGSINGIVPEGVVAIADSAFGGFWGDTYLENIKIASTVETISDYAFYSAGYSSFDLYIPENVRVIGMTAFNQSRIKSVSVSEKNKTFDSRNNCNALIETATDKLIFSCTTTIPEGVKILGEASVWHLLGEGTTLYLPSTLEEIEEYAFSAEFGDCWWASGACYIDSQPVTNGLTSTSTQSGLLYSVDSVYIKLDLDVSNATYLTNTANFTPEKVGDVVSDADGDGYILYTKVGV